MFLKVIDINAATREVSEPALIDDDDDGVEIPSPSHNDLRFPI